MMFLLGQVARVSVAVCRVVADVHNAMLARAEFMRGDPLSPLLIFLSHATVARMPHWPLQLAHALSCLEFKFQAERNDRPVGAPRAALWMRARVFRVTGGNTNRYATADLVPWGRHWQYA
jgi:hypothetical protein